MGDNSLDVSQLSDIELGKRLKEFDFDVGPITETTRQVYEKKLESLMKEKPVKKRTSIARSPVSAVNGQSSAVRSSPRNTRRRSALPTNGNHTVENGGSSPNVNSDQSGPGRHARRSVVFTAPSSSTQASPGRKAVGTASKRSTLSSLNAPTLATYSSAESSADDDEEEKPSQSAVLFNYITTKAKSPGVSNQSSKVPSPRVSLNKSRNFYNSDTKVSASTPRRSARITIASPSVDMGRSLANFSDSDTDGEIVGSVTTQTIRENLLKHRPSKSKEYPDEGVGTSSYSTFNGTSSSSNWISVTLLCLFIFFFLFIISFYSYSRISSSFFGKEAKTKRPLNSDLYLANLNAPICPKSDGIAGQLLHEFCIEGQENVQAAVYIVELILEYIKKDALDYLCSRKAIKEGLDPFSYSVTGLRTVVTDYQVEETLGLENFNLARAFNDAIKLIELNRQWGMTIDISGEESVVRINIDDMTLPMPLRCRVYVYVTKAFWHIGLSIVVIIALWGIYKYVHWKRKEISDEREMVFDLVEKSLELLQSPDNPQSVPVLHIRDMLLTHKDKKDTKMLKIWSKVVKFIEEKESRVKVDIENIDGEDFKTWKWIAASKASPSTSEGISSTVMKTGHIEWQGQAFGESENRNKMMEENDQLESNDTASNVNTNVAHNSSNNSVTTVARDFIAPTCFLKVRNMFDRELESDPNWKANIQNAILEKCSKTSNKNAHGVNHVFIDEKNTSEGVVYIKCDSIESATLAFKALHGWWCERKLVSVKFLKEERYYARFPEAKDLKTPLHYVRS